jgi:hypothetical protein
MPVGFNDTFFMSLMFFLSGLFVLQSVQAGALTVRKSSAGTSCNWLRSASPTKDVWPSLDSWSRFSMT